MPTLENHIEARIRFLPIEGGGRAKKPFSGYRPQYYCDGEDWIVSIFFDGDPPANGEHFIVYFSFLHPTHREELYVGKTFQIREGGQVVATGEVTKIMDLPTSTSHYINS